MKIKKEVLLEKLRERLAEANLNDAASLKKHKKEEADWPKIVRKQIRDAAKNLTDMELKKQSRESRYDNCISLSIQVKPQCPSRTAAVYESAIAEIELDSRQSFTILRTGVNRKFWLMLFPNPDQRMC